MKKIALLLSAVLTISLFPAVGYADGNTISTAAELEAFRENVNGGNTYEGQTVTLLTDVELSSESWEAIGTEEHPFKGTFDGNAKTITGLKASTEEMYCGLFGYNSGTIKNLNVETAQSGLLQTLKQETGVTKTAKHLFNGAVAAYNVGNISNCTAKGYVYGRNEYSYLAAGGICGMNKGTVTGCSNTARVNAEAWADYTILYGDAYAGGLCGINEGFVVNSVSAAEEKRNDDMTYIVSVAGVNASSRFSSAAAGGAVGDNRGTVSDVTASGYVMSCIYFAVGSMSYSYAGGISGSNTGTVTDSETDCSITAKQHSDGESNRVNFVMGGGISGYNNGELSDCTFNGILTAGASACSSQVAYAGGITAYNYGTVTGCEFGASARITDIRFTSGNRWANLYSPDYVGGICAYNNKGMITRCKANGMIYPAERYLRTIDKYYGGIVGENYGGTVSASSSSSSVILDGDGEVLRSELGLSSVSRDASTAASDSTVYAGGIAGNNGGVVENCYFNKTKGLKAYNIGGLSGVNTGVLENCYALSSIDTALIVNGAGICPQNTGITISCYFNMGSLDNTSENYRKTSELKKSETFVNWPFDLCWNSPNRQYPTLKDTDGIYEFSGGSGTVQSPYLIKTAEDLYSIRFYKDKCYRIANDIAYDYEWSPIGSEADPFEGVIDGNFNTITFKSINGNFGNAGFIGNGKDCTIKNLNIKALETIDVQQNGNTEIAYGGAVLAQGSNVMIENCMFDGNITVSAPYIYVGAVAGDITGNLKGCRSFGTISVGEGKLKNITLGGIAGRVNGSVLASESAVSITSVAVEDKAFANIGGIAGIIRGEIKNCCYNGSISNPSDSEASYTGSAVGLIDGDAYSSYADAVIEASEQSSAGGFASMQYNGIADEVYFNENADGMIGFGAEAEDFSSDELLNTFSQYNDNAYVWTKDKTTGKLTLLHVTPVWVVKNGFTKCGFEANSDTCEIYYTTDGSNPIGGGIKYTEPFLCDFENLKYYVKDNGADTAVFGYAPSVKHIYTMQFTEMPTNQNGEAISKENIASVTEVNVKFLSDNAVKNAKVYLAFYDMNDVLQAATCTDKDIESGTNSIKFENVSAAGATSIRVFIWDSALVPYTPNLKF